MVLRKAREYNPWDRPTAMRRLRTFLPRLQNLWNPIQKWCAGGCHVNREIDHLIRDSGFRILGHKRFYMEGPKILSYMYSGTASPN